jgi:predicted nucleotidyltransferase
MTKRATSDDPTDTLFRELERDENVRAVCLFGSTARGHRRADSDIDVLVVVPDGTSASEVRDRVRSSEARQRAQLRLMSEKRLKQAFSQGTVFAAHLAHEGQVVVDRDGALTRLLESHPRDEPVRETAKDLASQLQVYDNLDWCGGYYLFCFADLYAWGRSGAMLAVARAGHFEFDRDLVFDRLHRLFPDLKEAGRHIQRLRPFWAAVNRKRSEPFPFSPVGSDAEAVEARDACRMILEKGT